MNIFLFQYIRIINQLKGLMKIVTYATSVATIFVSKRHICASVIAHFDDITKFEIFPYLLHFSEVV